MELAPDVRKFIESQLVARLATVDANGRPHVVPICFALDGETLYTPIDEKPKRGDYSALLRLRNIAANPDVQVLFDHYEDDWHALRYVQLRGRAETLASSDEHAKAVRLLRERYAQYRAMDLAARPIIALRIERVVGWQFTQTEER